MVQGGGGPSVVPSCVLLDDYSQERRREIAESRNMRKGGQGWKPPMKYLELLRPVSVVTI